MELLLVGVLTKERAGMKMCENREVEEGGSTRLAGWVVCPERETKHVLRQSVLTMSSGISNSVFILALLFIAVHVFTIPFYLKYKKHSVIKRASPWFMILSLIFGCVTLVGAILLVKEPEVNKLGSGLCVGRVWTVSFGLAGVIASLLTKSYRMDKIFNNKLMKKLVMTDKDLLKIVGKLMIVELGILIAWTVSPNETPRFGWICGIVQDLNRASLVCGQTDEIVDPRQVCVPGTFSDGYAPIELKAPIRETSGSEEILVSELVQQGQCTTSETLYLLQLCYMGALMVWGVILAYRTMKVPKDYNESKWIAISIYNFAVLGPLVLIVQSIVGDSIDAVAVLRGFGLIIGIGTIWVLFHGSKVKGE